MGFQLFGFGYDGSFRANASIGTVLALGVEWEAWDGEYRWLNFYFGPLVVTFGFPVRAYWNAP